MEFNYKDMINALSSVEEDKNIPRQVVLEGLKEAFTKAYLKDMKSEIRTDFRRDENREGKTNYPPLADIDVFAQINEETETIDLYQNFKVLNDDDIQDAAVEMSLEDAREINPDAQIGDIVAQKIEVNSLSRAAVTLAKNVMKQKLREAEKAAVYDEYIDQLNDMVLGIIKSKKENAALVNIGKTDAIMPSYAMIPGEVLYEGQRIRVVITKVSKETKTSQVTVSRADPMLVKRLFEKEVPEIYNGTVEIKAIAREAGERTKMAVMSHNPEVDPIGACIGPRGQRVQEIIEDLHGEKIDIFLWNDDITELVRNALAPAEIEAVLPGEEDRSLLVVVRDDQLSLAIGKRGKNARLAVKLTNYKIDIKTREDIQEMGLDYEAMVIDAQLKKEEMRRERERQEIARLEEEARIAEAKRLEAAAKLIAENALHNNVEVEEDGFIPEEMQESVQEKIRDEMALRTDEKPAAVATVSEEKKTEDIAEPMAQEAEDNESEAVVEETPDNKAPTTTRKHADLEQMAAKNAYVSVFEKLTDTSKVKIQEPSRPRRKKKDEEEYRVRNKDLEKQIKSNYAANENRPIYTEEELAEIEAQRLAEEEKEYDIDYDEYEDYYDEDDN